MHILKKTLVYFIALTALAFVLRFFIHEGLRKNQVGLFDKLNTIFHQSTVHELIFVGSSRAECHFNPQIFDSITGLKSYNIGISGSNNSFTYGILKSYLSNRIAPKIIIMNVDFHLANESSDTIYEFPRFFPYLDNQLLFHELAKRDKRFYAFKYIPFFSLPFLGEKYLNTAFRGYTNHPSTYDLSSHHGFQPIHPIEYKKINKADTISRKVAILQENIDYLDSIINLCELKNSKLYFVVSPTHHIASKRIKNSIQHLGVFEALANQRKIPFINYTNDSICSRDELFADFYHMKKEGADIFTTKFSKEFKSNYLVKVGSIN